MKKKSFNSQKQKTNAFQVNFDLKRTDANVHMKQNDEYSWKKMINKIVKNTVQ